MSKNQEFILCLNLCLRSHLVDIFYIFYLPPGSPAGDYNLHHVCAYMRAGVSACVRHAVFSETTTVTHFYPTALKGCWGIVFTHGVRMGGRAAGKEFVRAVSQKP